MISSSPVITAVNYDLRERAFLVIVRLFFRGPVSAQESNIVMGI